MELIYLWVSDYRNIENTGFKLSSNFDVKFNNNNKGYRELVIRNLTINNLLFEEKNRKCPCYYRKKMGQAKQISWTYSVLIIKKEKWHLMQNILFYIT